MNENNSTDIINKDKTRAAWVEIDTKTALKNFEQIKNLAKKIMTIRRFALL